MRHPSSMAIESGSSSQATRLAFKRHAPQRNPTPIIHRERRRERSNRGSSGGAPWFATKFFRAKIIEGIHEQAPGGKPLLPLAPTTLAIRRSRGFKGIDLPESDGKG